LWAAACRRAGLTLAELSISLGVIATLMVATGSIMVLTGKAIAVTTHHAADARVDDIVTTMMSEQRLALTVTERTATSITFTVADRTGDGLADQVRYAWSGVSGDPLTRQVNDLMPVVVARDVKKFGLSYLTKTAVAAAPPAELESAEEVIYNHAAGSSVAAVSSSSWQGQCFKTTLSRPTATSWRITSVRLNASRPVGSTGSWTVGVYPDAGNKPGALALFEQNFSLSGLTPAPKPYTLTFTKIDQNLAPDGKYWIVLKPVLLTAAPLVAYDGASAPDNGQMLTTGNLLWTEAANPSRDMNITVSGIHKYPAP
jgi:hypothetical protein